MVDVAAAPVTFESGTAQVALIELFTSEGCSSCPPAEKWLGELKKEPQLWRDFVPVAFHVNYWDRLGWRDVLASKAYTDREYAYAARWGAASVYTPCFVRDGAEWRPEAARRPEPPRPRNAGQLKVTWLGAGNECRISYLPASNPGARQQSYDGSIALLGSEVTHQIRAGENAGRRLEHDFVALRLKTVPLKQEANGEWTAVVALPSRSDIAAGRLALAGWVSRSGELAPLQATGGWLKTDGDQGTARR